ncbi:MAG: type II secretion system protein [Deltaproteobacteria bacterium]
MGVSKRKRRRTAGFSLVEALIAAGVLGVALTALVRLHQSSMRGTVSSSRIGDASEVARQIADNFAVFAVDNPTNCPNAAARTVPLAALDDCGTIFASAPGGVCSSVETCVPLGCTFDFDIHGNIAPAAAGPPLNGRFRVRIMEGQNPAGDGWRVATIVCWNDSLIRTPAAPVAGQRVSRRVVADRLAVPGL